MRLVEGYGEGCGAGCGSDASASPGANRGVGAAPTTAAPTTVALTLKSYQMLNRPAEAVAIGQVAKVAEQLKDMGFKVLTARFGEHPSVTIKPCADTVRLVSVCTGQSGVGGQMFRDCAAVIDGVKVVWHKPIRLTGLH